MIEAGGFILFSQPLLYGMNKTNRELDFDEICYCTCICIVVVCFFWGVSPP
jgi:hypothetical protein